MLVRQLTRLWGEDPEWFWPKLKWFVSPATLAIARGSAGYGLSRIPATGGAVLAINHLSALDPPLVGTYVKRCVHYMAKAELLAMPVIGESLMATGAFPVRRGEGDREAIRLARAIVADGHLVGLFVEGTRQRLGYPGRVQPGATMIAMRENVPVIPCGLYSTGWRITNRTACALVVGEPIDLSHLPRNGRGYEEAGRIVGAAILALWRQAAEAVAAGMPPALPDGTPREQPAGPGFLRLLTAR